MILFQIHIPDHATPMSIAATQLWAASQGLCLVLRVPEMTWGLVEMDRDF